MKISLLICLVLYLFVTSCSNVTGESHRLNDTLVNQEYYGNGDLKRDMYKNGDTMFVRNYFENKSLQDEWVYFDRRVFVKEFYESGKIKCINNYSYIDVEKKQKTGRIISYYENGKISQIRNLDLGKDVGAFACFFINGQMKKYVLNTFNEEAFYYRYFDSLGNITEEWGFPASFEFNSDHLSLADTLRLDFLIGFQPGWCIDLNVYEIAGDSTSQITHQYFAKDYLMENFDNHICVNRVFKTKGIKKILSNIKISDTKYSREYSHIDTLIVSVKNYP